MQANPQIGYTECVTDPNVYGPWLNTVVAFEHFDMGRTHLFRCATFSGQFDGANTVTAAALPQTYVTPYNLVIDKTGASFIYAGAYGDYPGAPGSFVAKIDAGGNELWRTQLKELARSAGLPKMTSGALVTPGENGTINYLSLAGEIYRITIKAATHR